MGEKDRREDYSVVGVRKLKYIVSAWETMKLIAIDHHRNGCWCIVQCLSLFPASKIMSETTTERFSPDMQWENRESKNIDKRSTDNDNLINRIGILENEQIHQMEYLANITRILEEYKKGDAHLQKENNDKIINVKNEADINRLHSTIYNELRIIKHEFKKLHGLYAELKSCCDVNSAANQNLEEHMEKILLSYLPPGTSRTDLAKIIESLLSSSRKEDQVVHDNKVNDVRTHVSEERVREIVKEILRIYDADKTGQADYALESAGGQIISTRCTQRYSIKSRAFGLFNFLLYFESDDPRTVIQGKTLQPGVCWAFQDFPGYLLIRLRNAIYVTGFTLEHVPRLLLPNENMSSAPKKFNVWGFTDENDPEPVMFGDYEFVYSDDSLQYFPVQNTEINRLYEFIELRIHSNYGKLEYTCLYRFRVHGKSALI